MHTFPKEVIEKAADVLGGRRTLREVKGITDAQMELLYGVGYALYRSGRSDDAAAVFQVLCLYDPNVARHWLGLAGSLERLGRCGPAAIAYRMLRGIEPGNIEAMIHGAEMELGAGDSRAARDLTAQARRFEATRHLRESLRFRLAAVERALDHMGKENVQ